MGYTVRKEDSKIGKIKQDNAAAAQQPYPVPAAALVQAAVLQPPQLHLAPAVLDTVAEDEPATTNSSPSGTGPSSVQSEATSSVSVDGLEVIAESAEHVMDEGEYEAVQGKRDIPSSDDEDQDAPYNL